MTEFLFELGVEEVPVSSIKNIMDQLVKGFTENFNNRRIEYGLVETAMTNRRFLVFFNNISPFSKSKIFHQKSWKTCIKTAKLFVLADKNKVNSFTDKYMI